MRGDLSETPFRIYAVDESGEPEHLSSTDEYSLGQALIEQHKRGVEIRGILYRPIEGERGQWLINCFSG